MLEEFTKGPACLFLKYLWMLPCMSVNKEMLRDCIRKPELEKLKVNLDIVSSFLYKCHVVIGLHVSDCAEVCECEAETGDLGIGLSRILGLTSSWES